MSDYSFDYINNSVNLVENDKDLFKTETIEQLNIVEECSNDYLKQEDVINNNDNSSNSLKTNKQAVNKEAQILLTFLFSELKLRYSVEARDAYFKEFTPYNLSKSPKDVSLFCKNFIVLNEERNKNEVPEAKEKIEKLKELTDKYIKTESDFIAKSKSDLNNFEQIDRKIQNEFEKLKNSVKGESLQNEKINFRFYFPAIKVKKNPPAKTIVDEMDFDIFVKLSDIPSDLKINKIFLLWFEELKVLFYKKRISEFKSLQLADEFIINNHKK